MNNQSRPWHFFAMGGRMLNSVNHGDLLRKPLARA